MNETQPHVDAALAEVEANHINEPINYEDWFARTNVPIIKDGKLIYEHKSLMNNYLRLSSWPIIKRSYESPLNLFMLAFKPFNKLYNPNTDFMDHVRKKIGSHKAVIITREINATKVHYHAIVITDKALDEKLHDKQTNTFKISCIKCPMKDKYRIHDYIVYESRKRYFYNKRGNWHKQDIYTK